MPPPTVPMGLPAPIRLRRQPDFRVPQFTVARASQAPWVRGVNDLGRMFGSLGSPTAEALWARAQRLHPETGDPSPEARAGLDALVGSMNQDAALSFIGKIAARIDTGRMAVTHLRMEHALRRTPEVLQTELPTPLFVLGLFRSGTTALHRLLAQDQDNRTLPHWESFDPVHSPQGPAARQRELARTLRLADLLSPSIKAIHPMSAYDTDECRALFTNVFRTPQFNVQYRVPSYLQWLLRQDARIAYAAYRRQLQLVQYHRPAGRRFVLKDPTHTFFIDSIAEIFPDARFIFIHRDPVKTMSSICSLHAYTRSVFSSDVEAKSLGRELSESYLTTMFDDALAAADRIGSDRLTHVRADALSRSPIATIAEAYRELGMELSDQARQSMAAYLDAEKQIPSPRHDHRTHGFGLDEAALYERFAKYCERFGFGRKGAGGR